MKRSHFSYFLAILFLIFLALSACSSSSNHEVTASQYPYGADGISAMATDSGDTSIQSFEYNSALQVIGHNIEYTSYDDNDGGDPVINSRHVYNYTYDPSITSASSVPTNLTPVAQASSLQYSDFGAVLSYTSVTYELDDETGILGTSPTSKRENYYSYTDSGLLLEQTYVRTYYGEVTRYSYIYTYNSAEDITSYTYTSVDPDGSSSTTTEAYSYDSYGNVITYIKTVDEVVEIEITYTHSYTDGLRMQTIVTINAGEMDEETYQIDFLYNAQNQAISKITSTDEYNDDDVYDSFTTNTYTYDSAGRLLSDSEVRNYDSNNDAIIDYLSRVNLIWEYNEQGLMTTSSTEIFSYSDPIAPTLSSHYKYINSYSYADNGNISMRSYEYLIDADLDGSSFEVTSYEWSYGYSYNEAGYLTASTYARNDFSSSWSNARDVDYTYTDSILTEMNSVQLYDGSQDYRYDTLFIYDDDGQLAQIATEDIDEDGTDIGTYTLTYNDDQAVTILFEEDEIEYYTMTVDFTSEGIPTGTADITMDSAIITYPNSPETEIDLILFNMISQADDNDKSYLMQIQAPKMLEFLYNGVDMGID